MAANGIGFFLTTSVGKPLYHLMACRLFERCCGSCCHLPCCLAASNKLNHCVNHCEHCSQQMAEKMHSMRSMTLSDEQRCSEFVKQTIIELEVAGTGARATKEEVETKMEETDEH